MGATSTPALLLRASGGARAAQRLCLCITTRVPAGAQAESQISRTRRLHDRLRDGADRRKGFCFRRALPDGDAPGLALFLPEASMTLRGGNEKITCSRDCSRFVTLTLRLADALPLPPTMPSCLSLLNSASSYHCDCEQSSHRVTEHPLGDVLSDQSGPKKGRSSSHRRHNAATPTRPLAYDPATQPPTPTIHPHNSQPEPRHRYPTCPASRTIHTQECSRR